MPGITGIVEHIIKSRIQVNFVRLFAREKFIMKCIM